MTIGQWPKRFIAVKEPVVFTGAYDDNVAARRRMTNSMSEPLFYISDISGNINALDIQLVLKYRESTIWHISITKDGMKHYFITERGNDKETFVAHLKEYHPEYLEWLLFHPEWL
jgi:hypothetical protein